MNKKILLVVLALLGGFVQAGDSSRSMDEVIVEIAKREGIPLVEPDLLAITWRGRALAEFSSVTDLATPHASKNWYHLLQHDFGFSLQRLTNLSFCERDRRIELSEMLKRQAHDDLIIKCGLLFGLYLAHKAGSLSVDFHASIKMPELLDRVLLLAKMAKDCKEGKYYFSRLKPEVAAAVCEICVRSQMLCLMALRLAAPALDGPGGLHV